MPKVRAKRTPSTRRPHDEADRHATETALSEEAVVGQPQPIGQALSFPTLTAAAVCDLTQTLKKTVELLERKMDCRAEETRGAKNPLELAMTRLNDHAAETSATPAAPWTSASLNYGVNMSTLSAVEIVAPPLRKAIQSDQRFWRELQPYIITESQMKSNAYPMPDPANPAIPKFYSINYYDQEAAAKASFFTAHQKLCCRCEKVFVFDPKGTYPVEQCNYHWGRLIKGIYRCCGARNERQYCATAKRHVHEMNRYEDLTGYVKTVSRPEPANGYGVYAVDCEMVFTTHGRELASIAVVDSHLNPVYETLVKPGHEIIDYQTRFSGLREGCLNNIHITLQDVQRKLLELFSEKTVMIGHGMHHDFRMMKIFHPTLVDTSLVFPERRGPPFKKALRQVVEDFLGETLQEQEGEHKSRGDAVAVMKLMRKKVNQI